MKKTSFTITLALIATLLCSCSPSQEQSSVKMQETKNITTISTQSTTKKQPPEVHLQQGGVYKNEKLGFQLNFPDSWKNYYVINQCGEECIQICFYGESKIYQEYQYSECDCPGTPIFYICTEAHRNKQGNSAAGVKKLGKVGDITYYKYNQTDYPLSYPGDDLITTEYGKSEIDITKKDHKKVQEMEKDIDTILNSFKSIK